MIIAFQLFVVMARPINKNLIAQDEWEELWMCHMSMWAGFVRPHYTEIPTHERSHIYSSVACNGAADDRHKYTLTKSSGTSQSF